MIGILIDISYSIVKYSVQLFYYIGHTAITYKTPKSPTKKELLERIKLLEQKTRYEVIN